MRTRRDRQVQTKACKAEEGVETAAKGENDGKRDGIGNQSRCIKEKQPAKPIIMVRARVYNNKRKKF